MAAMMAASNFVLVQEFMLSECLLNEVNHLFVFIVVV